MFPNLQAFERDRDFETRISDLLGDEEEKFILDVIYKRAIAFVMNMTNLVDQCTLVVDHNE